jgi:GTP-binding protein
VHDEVFDLFAALDASEEQLDFPTLFASGRNGWAVEKMGDEPKDLSPLFDLIIKHVPAPKVNADAPFTMLATILEANPFLGRLLTGRIQSGTVKVNMPVKGMTRDGTLVEQGRITKILSFRGLERYRYRGGFHQIDCCRYLMRHRGDDADYRASHRSANHRHDFFRE